jgi:hypothetical protein
VVLAIILVGYLLILLDVSILMVALLSRPTNAGMAGVTPRDSGVAGGLVNVAHRRQRPPGARAACLCARAFAHLGCGQAPTRRSGAAWR